MKELKLNNLTNNVIKLLKRNNSIQKDAKIDDNTFLNGASSPFDSVSFIEFTTLIEEEVEKAEKKSFHIILNEIPKFKKGSGVIKIKDIKNYILKKSKK